MVLRAAFPLWAGYLTFSQVKSWRFIAIVALASIGAGIACDRRRTSKPNPQANMTASRIRPLIEKLNGTDASVRKQVLGDIAELGRKGLTFEEGCQAIDAAARAWPTTQATDEDPSEVLVTAATSHARDEHIESLVKNFTRFSERARWVIVQALVERADGAAARAYLQIINDPESRRALPPARLTGFAKSSAACDVLLPSLLAKSGADELGYEIQLFALRAAEGGRATNRSLAPFVGRALELYRPMRDRMRRLEKPDGNDWIWTDEYGADRGHATLLLDLMRFLPGEAVIEALEEALGSRDPRVRHFAALSLLRRGRNVTPAAVEPIAASAEMRNWFYDGLSSCHRLDLFPKRFLTQEAFAESEMVGWLIYPTELGRAPHEIELMATFDDAPGAQRYYLFRFRTHAPHWAAKNGWMSGLCGPYDVASMPTTKAGGSTFSTFTKWDAKTPRQHFEAISGLIEEHWKQRAGGLDKENSRDRN
jgi:hypothetical protein